MSDAPAESPLMELFRQEVRAAVQALSGGLLGLEQASSDVQRLEPLVRAAHSVRGAARVVRGAVGAKCDRTDAQRRVAPARQATGPLESGRIKPARSSNLRESAP